MEKPFSPKDYVKEKGIKKIGGEDELKGMCEEVISENPQAVEDYNNGEKKAIQFLVGQIMKKTKGQADAAVVSKLFAEILK